MIWLIHKAKGNNLQQKETTMEYTIGIQLPLPPSFSQLPSDIGRKNEKFKAKLSKKIGHKIKLIGKNTWNPCHQVDTTFPDKDTAEKLLALINQEINSAIASGELVYNYQPPNVQSGNPSWIHQSNT